MKYTSSNDTNNKKSTLIPLLWTIFAIALSFGLYSVIPLYLFLLLVIGYIIGGIIDLDSIPDDKKHLEIGCDENPVPLVQFLPDLNKQTVIAEKKPGRNDPCLCGSGKKFKKCCGK